jgi:hypothetical protein
VPANARRHVEVLRGVPESDEQEAIQNGSDKQRLTDEGLFRRGLRHQR